MQHHFAIKAKEQRRSCLRALAEVDEILSDGVHLKPTGPAGFKERWEHFPIHERPTVNICGRWVARSAEDKRRLLEQMHFPDGIQIPADASVRMYGDELPDGGRWWGP